MGCARVCRVQNSIERHDMPFKLKTDFEAPADTHTVLILTRNYWGRGKTKDEAMAKTKEMGGRPAQHGYVAYYFGEGFKVDDAYVTSTGYVEWHYTDETVEAWKQGHMPPQPVKEERLPKA